MLKFFEFSKEKFQKIPILKEFEWFEWFEWFGPSPIEPFNSGPEVPRGARGPRRQVGRVPHDPEEGRRVVRRSHLTPRRAAVQPVLRGWQRLFIMQVRTSFTLAYHRIVFRPG